MGQTTQPLWAPHPPAGREVELGAPTGRSQRRKEVAGGPLGLSSFLGSFAAVASLPPPSIPDPCTRSVSPGSTLPSVLTCPRPGGGGGGLSLSWDTLKGAGGLDTYSGRWFHGVRAQSTGEGKEVRRGMNTDSVCPLESSPGQDAAAEEGRGAGPGLVGAAGGTDVAPCRTPCCHCAPGAPASKHPLGRTRFSMGFVSVLFYGRYLRPLEPRPNPNPGGCPPGLG